MSYEKNRFMSQEMVKYITDYYAKAYLNQKSKLVDEIERKTIPEIAKELVIAETSVRNYLTVINDQFKKTDVIYLRTMLQTKLNSTNEYYEIQQKLFERIRKVEATKKREQAKKELTDMRDELVNSQKNIQRVKMNREDFVKAMSQKRGLSK